MSELVKLTVDDIDFSYGRKKILKDVSLSVGNGEIIGILGQNGSGKTTLLNCIDSEIKPSKGVVVISDFSEGSLEDRYERARRAFIEELTDREKSRIIAMVEQCSSVSFPFTVLETVKMGRYSHTRMVDEDSDEEIKIVEQAIRDTGVLMFADRQVNELSGGEFRRVMIAQALAQEPEILLLDEPTLHLDTNHQFELMDLLRRIVKERKILIVVVTHDLPLATRYCDKIIMMKHGEVVDAGTVSEVITEENIADVFHMKAKVYYDEDIDGTNVIMIRKISENEDDPDP